MHPSLRLLPLLLLLPLSFLFAAPQLPDGHAVIRGKLDDSEVVITTTPRTAGAIHSVRWNGKEFIDSFDHGRQLQSAINLDAGTAYTNETFNPTEAGGEFDGHGDSSTSQLLHLKTRENALQTTTRMAFWLKPTGKSGDNPAKNKTLLSDHLLTKRVQIGYRNLSQVIVYNVTFSIPIGEKHHYAQFEAVTGYMPAEFRVFRQFNPGTGELEALSDGPGEQPNPVVLATEDGKYAMGIYSPETPKGMTGPGYGRFRFPRDKVVKWNSVFRLRDDRNEIPAGEYSFRNFVLIGDVKRVTEGLRELRKK